MESVAYDNGELNKIKTIFERWFENVEDNSNYDVLFFVAEEKVIEDFFTDFVLNCNNKIGRLILSEKFINKSIITDSNYRDRIITRKTWLNDKRHCYIFANCYNTINIGGLENINHINNIEWSRSLRVFCKEIIYMNYQGPTIYKGFWRIDNSRSTVNYMVLKLSKWGNITQNITPALEKNFENDIESDSSNVWVDNVKEFIISFFTMVLSDDDPDYRDMIINRFIDDKSMSIWIKSLISPTINYISNYETLEFVGDKIMSADFARYMSSTYPRIKNNELNNCDAKYMSEQFQSFFADDLQLSERGIKSSHLEMVDKIRTDFLESFFGAVNQISKNVMNGLELVMTYKIMNFIAEAIPIQISDLTKDYKEKVVLINKFILGNSGVPFTFSKRSSGRVSAKGGNEFNVFIEIDEQTTKWLKAHPMSEYIADELETSTTKNLYDDVINLSNKIFYEDFTSFANAENKIWKSISSLYDLYGIEFVNISKTENEIDPIFTKMARDMPTHYNDFIDKLMSKIYIDKEIELSDDIILRSIDFKVDKKRGYLYIYRNIIDTSSGVPTIIDTTPVAPYTQLDEKYQQDIISNIQLNNIGFVSMNSKIQQTSQYTNYRGYVETENGIQEYDVTETSKINCILEFMGIFEKLPIYDESQHMVSQPRKTTSTRSAPGAGRGRGNLTGRGGGRGRR